jgi:deoxyadenosine/deoxycytidine kinase
VEYERLISEDYLYRLVDAYVRFFHHYNAAPLLIVNAADINLTGGDSDYENLVARIKSRPVGRQYLNLNA